MEYDINELRKLFTTNHIINSNGKLNANRSLYLKEGTELYSKYTKYVSCFRSEREAFYCLKNNIYYTNIPRCPMCGNLAKFIGKRYNLTCGNCNYQEYSESIAKCKASMTPAKVALSVKKVKETCLRKYGKEVVNQFYNEETKRKYEEDCLAKFGVRNAGQSASAIEKRKKTCLEKFGVDCNFKLGDREEHSRKAREVWKKSHDEILEKIRKTSLFKYGVENTSQSKEVREKMQRSKEIYTDTFEKLHNCTRFYKVVEQYGQGWKRLLQTNELNYIEDDNKLGKYISNDDLKKIEDYYNSDKIFSVSKSEKEIREYISSIYSGDVLNNKRNVISMNGKQAELDIYIPDKNVAIEYNGCYWHSDNNLPNKYHLTKTNACKEKNIRLIHIFEDEWKMKNEICKSIIAASIGFYNYSLMARKCTCKTISPKEYRDFLTNNHIQGSISSKHKYGLFYNGELVQVIGIGKSRFGKINNNINNNLNNTSCCIFELHRMCTKIFTKIVGGFSKLIKFAVSDIKEKENLDKFELISYLSKAHDSSELFESAGFEFIEETKPSYFYVKSHDFVRQNRMKYQKHKLSKVLKNYDENLSERENMKANGYFCVYDCGTEKYKLVI